jgi:MFS family permease
LSFKDILSNSIFWILTIIFTLQLSANLGVYTHIPIFSQDLGYSPLQASWIYSVAAFHAAMGKIVFGRLLDNLGARRTILISLFFHGLGIAILIFATNLVMLLLAVMVMGLGLGGTIPLLNSTFAIAFGNANFGKARGLIGPFMVPMQITAAPLSGWLYDTYGNYSLAFSINVVLCVIAGIVALFLHLPDRK